MGGLIPFPDIPAYPGVPALTRSLSVTIAENPILSIAIGSVENLLISALQQASQWGIFDQFGNRLGVDSNDTSTGHGIISTLISQLTGNGPPVLSTFGVEFSRESRVSNFPVEQGSFANYNKVQLPANPVVTLILDGSENDRTHFLAAIDTACNSTALYSVVTPEVVYANYTIERYSYSRRASRGATLLMVEIYLEEVRQVSSSFAAVQIVAPQNASATPQENNGIVQPAAPAQSTLLQLNNSVSSFLSPMFSGGK